MSELAKVAGGLARFGGLVFCALQLGDVVLCVGPSMLPTLNEHGDIVLLDKITPRFRRLRNGEVVIAKSPSNFRQTVCKRIVASEGETVGLKHRYNSSRIEMKTVPKGHVWLEGDNKKDSHDSRYYGPVPYALIQGRVALRIWPLTQLGSLASTPLTTD
ncbi:mitochondrial inner membrane protease subunit 1 [Saprolegnia diclina VS20]|uniref:Mitochondrial inner membrane protease subunit n=1 Tax=Saprolegnia diclina (strain VS20) TaxID=1156394 RepID=T0Q1W8_SAPDV|nr:mitochondrial inner membrane protease subunit 1 [Saprolegnia diclina VS20]EQC28526.1 mitochondrial inner membrane protease subunit 1 [Saprolegnia diclina VS20]|eukprot:XP_008618174.1 mitochondrial inner membrane protease subunit 1 [Saprolegnia diclina VS20]